MPSTNPKPLPSYYDAQVSQNSKVTSFGVESTNKNYQFRSLCQGKRIWTIFALLPIIKSTTDFENIFYRWINFSKYDSNQT